AIVGGRWKLLVLAEDWCGDAANTVPVLARLAEELPNFELRIIKRDGSLEVMDRFLTNGTRSIPMAIILDETFEPVGTWGPRPSELQEFVISEKAKGERPVKEIYADSRRWYARDRGETTLRELLDILAASGVLR
ncbi:MAG: thioredoxin family protein, partial [Gemmatimonadales bacterium]